MQTSAEHGATPKPSYINGANSVHTGFVQVQLQLHRSLHLHVVLEEAASERGLFVGLPSQVPQRGLRVLTAAVFQARAGPRPCTRGTRAGTS